MIILRLLLFDGVDFLTICLDFIIKLINFILMCLQLLEERNFKREESKCTLIFMTIFLERSLNILGNFNTFFFS